MELRSISDLAEEAVEHAPAVNQLPADDLEDFQPAHQLVLSEVHDAHAALTEFAEDFVVGMVDEACGQAADGWGRRHPRRGSQYGEAIGGGDGEVERLGAGLGVAEAAQEAVGGERGDALPAIRAALQVDVDRFGRGIVELAQAVGVQDLVSRMGNLRSVHGIGLRVESGRAPCAGLPMDYESPGHEAERAFRRDSPQRSLRRTPGVPRETTLRRSSRPGRSCFLRALRSAL